MRTRFIFFLLLTLLIGPNCKNKKSENISVPKEYIHKDYGFAITFENPPKKQESVVPTNIGNVIAVAIGDEQENESYIVLLNVYPEKYKDQVNASESIKKQVLETAKNMNMTIIEEKENNWQNLPSFYVFAQNLDNNQYTVIQGVASGNNVYIIAGLAKGEQGDQIVNSKGEEFIKSFRLLK